MAEDTPLLENRGSVDSFNRDFDFVGKMNELEREVRESAAVIHPFYRAVKEGALSREQVVAFTEQQYFISTSFAPSVAAVYARLPDYNVSRILIDHFLIGEAWGTKEKDAHSNLFRLWMSHLNMEEMDVMKKETPEMKKFIRERLDVCSDSNYFIGLGFLAFYEYMNSIVYDILSKGLRKMEYPPEKLLYFDAHAREELGDYGVIRSIIARSVKSEADWQGVEEGVRHMLSLRQSFLDSFWSKLSTPKSSPQRFF